MLKFLTHRAFHRGYQRGFQEGLADAQRADEEVNAAADGIQEAEECFGVQLGEPLIEDIARKSLALSVGSLPANLIQVRAKTLAMSAAGALAPATSVEKPGA